MLDRLIATLPFEIDGDLALCHEHGIAYQRDRGFVVDYGLDYWRKYVGYEDSSIARRINVGRESLVNKYVGIGGTVDIGIGSGEFIKYRPNTFGRDINPVAIEWLKHHDLWVDRLEEFESFSFWDVIEHVPEPEEYFRHVPIGAHLFTSMPIFENIDAIRRSKHYRPGEHLYYFGEAGFVNWMEWHGFLLLDLQDFEIQAGREAIYSFAFKRIKAAA